MTALPSQKPPGSQSRSPVEFVRPELDCQLEKYERIRAALDGEEAVKELGDKVLPRPNADDLSVENRMRYDSYLKRAVFYNVSSRTLGGMTGYVFQKEPIVKLPETLTSLEENVDGAGVTLNQQAKEALRLLLGLGRGGLLVDYPTTPGATTRAAMLQGNIRPTIILYQPEQITNWRTSFMGAKNVLDLVVLKECRTIVGDKDEFALVQQVQYRVLNRDEEGVHGRIFRQDEDQKFVEVPDEAFEPKNSNGKPFMEIPFVFLGAVNNDSAVDSPPMLDLVNLNLAHFRNSADHEESCFLVGQPTPWISGLSEGWVKEVLNGAIHLGSRAVIPLPVNGAAGLLQADANTMPFEAMKHKEQQMVAIGAKLVQEKEVQRTATEAGIDHAHETSVLTSAATNMFLGYKQAFLYCGQYVGDETASVEFELTEPLGAGTFTPDQANSVMALWQGGLIDFEEARFQLKKTGVAWKADEKVKTAIENEGLPTNPNDPAAPPADPNKPQPKPTE